MLSAIGNHIWQTTDAEIAGATHLPLGTVKSHVLRGREKSKWLYGK